MLAFFCSCMPATCEHVQSLYGKKAITPNMHMHLHLKDMSDTMAYWSINPQITDL